jgi:hypothetical protein
MQLHSRRQKDANFITTKALHTTLAVTSSFDLGQVAGGLVEGLQLEVVSPADVATTATICTYTLQDSADNVTFADVDPSVSTSITAASSALAAKTVEFPLPVVTRRYIRVKQSGNTLGAVAGTFTVSLLF